METVKPILFSAPMIQAILEGRKKQTRRIIKNPSKIESDDNFEVVERCHLITAKSGLRKIDVGNPYLWPEIYDHHRKDKEVDNYIHLDCPYGQTGGALWVRETFSITHQSQGHEYPEVEIEDADFIPKNCEGAYWKPCYHADWTRDETVEDRGFKWRPSIHMPRWINRITLEIKDIRVERLQDISEEDAEAESIVQFANKGYAHYGAILVDRNRIFQTDIEFVGDTAVEAFRLLWQSINGSDSWNKNPWVWIVEFEAHQCNIDEYLKQKKEK